MRDKSLVHIPRITKTAKYLQAVTSNRELTVYHFRILSVLREMNTIVPIIAGLTGIQDSKVHTKLKELEAWQLIEVTEERATGRRAKKFWGLHSDFRDNLRVRTYPSVPQEQGHRKKGVKGARIVEMETLATLIWDNPETSIGDRPEALVEIATTLRPCALENQKSGDADARREAVPQQEPKITWDINDFLEEDT